MVLRVNEWLQLGGYEQAEQDEWDEFEQDGAFDDAQPEDLQQDALLELFVEWRGSDRQQERAMDQRVHDWNCSREALDRDPPPPVFPRTEPRTEPAPPCAVPAVAELPPSLLPVWPQPTYMSRTAVRVPRQIQLY